MMTPAAIPTSSDRPGKRRTWTLAALLAGLVAAGLGALSAGTYPVSLPDLWRVLAGGEPAGAGAADSRVAAAIVWQLRMPRVLLAMMVGGALAASGAVFQASFRNPLVEPYILGVSSGAAFGAALGVVVPSFPMSVQVAAFAGALAAVGLVHAMTRRRADAPVVVLVLSGVIVGSMFAAGVSILKYLADDAALRDIVFWLMGGFYFASWRDAWIAGAAIAVSGGVMAAGGWTLNVLAMGDHEAQTLGIEPRRARRVLLAAATVATAVSVSVAGIVPWVGLMIPHAARMMVGSDNRLVVPASMVLGALFLLACDTAARSLTASEIPVGIVTALAGGPFLAYLVRERAAALAG
ncbi:MAG: iron ABC transporter permease [Acidobacteria bacterium]|nr:iron ABC transporter permease [Acidobacteriota bacterium]